MLAQGAEHGASKAERDMLLRMVGVRFGTVPEEVRRSVEAADRQSVERLAERL